MNPSGTVPTLVADYGNGESITMTQSLSMLDFLEESYSGVMRLIPPVTDMAARSKARDLAALIACDVQPLQSNRATQEFLRLQGREKKVQMAQRHIINGIRVYETMINGSAGRYSIGDELSIADVCLVPMVQAAYRFGLMFDKTAPSQDDAAYPNVLRIVKECESMPAFRESRVMKQVVFPPFVANSFTRIGARVGHDSVTDRPKVRQENSDEKFDKVSL